MFIKRVTGAFGEWNMARRWKGKKVSWRWSKLTGIATLPKRFILGFAPVRKNTGSFPEGDFVAFGLTLN
jgi:hypothetical protein